MENDLSKLCLEQKKYLSAIDLYCFRVALTQLQLGVLPINSNMYRYSDCPTNKTVYFAKTRLKMKITSFGLSSVHGSKKQIPWTKRYSVVTEHNYWEGKTLKVVDCYQSSFFVLSTEGYVLTPRVTDSDKPEKRANCAVVLTVETRAWESRDPNTRG